jgi:hypothetical protein
MYPDPDLYLDPAVFVIGLQGNENQGFSYYIVLVIERFRSGFGFGSIPLISGSGSRLLKNIRIRRIPTWIRNTGRCIYMITKQQESRFSLIFFLVDSRIWILNPDPDLPLTNGSRSGSRMPKNIRIRIRNTCHPPFPVALFPTPSPLIDSFAEFSDPTP